MKKVQNHYEVVPILLLISIQSNATNLLLMTILKLKCADIRIQIEQNCH